MAANLGFGSLIIAFLLSVYCGVMTVIGGWRKIPVLIESARLGVRLLFPLTSLSVLCLTYLLIRGEFNIYYVYTVISSDLPVHLRLTALWGGQEGSLLFWSWLLALYAFGASGFRRDVDDDLKPWVLAVFAITMAFFLSLSVFFENPFVRMWQTTSGDQLTAMFQPEGALAVAPGNGFGLNPLLRHPGMIYHPPALYLGFVGFTIPFAYGIAALITGRKDYRWIRYTRRWTLLAWLFLSLGLLLGSRWAYDVLGWGGYWGWDPVEIAALMPWLTGTAYLHSIITQEKLGMFKRWNIVLIIVTYGLVILGVFLTRSGILSSVHAFSESVIGPYFWGFVAVVLCLSFGLLAWRWNDLRTEIRLDSLFSREVLFLFNNFVFVGIMLVCLWGVLYPILTNVFLDQKITVGPPFYERATAPLFASLLLLMGVAPLSAWGHSTWKTTKRGLVIPAVISLLVILVTFISGVRSPGALLGFGLIMHVITVTVHEYARGIRVRCRQTGEPVIIAFWKLADRNRRRYGGYIIHLGIVLMALGIIGIEVFQQETQGTISRGETMRLGQYDFTYRDLAVFDSSDGRNIARAVVSVELNGQERAQVFPRRDYYYDSQQPVTVPGVLSSLEEDLYVVLVDWQPISSREATFKIYRNPLINWLWLGGFVLMFGTVVAAWPVTRDERDRAAQMAARLSMKASDQ